MQMTHLDDGTLLTLLDDELATDRRAAVTSHVDRCAVCAERLDELERERSLLAATLPALDVDPSLGAAREAILAHVRGAESATGHPASRADGPSSVGGGAGRQEAAEVPDTSEPAERVARLPRRTEGPKRATPRWWRPELAKAAGLLLVFAAAAAAAIPGSPVRSWLADVVRPSDLPSPAAESAAEAAADAVSEPEGGPQEVGIQMDPGGGELVVSLSGLPQGAEVQVRLVAGIRSWVYAAEGARFQTRPGAVVADVPGEYVRVELARSLALASVEVDGVLYLRKTGDRLELAGPQRDSTEAEIRFEVP